MNTTLATIQGQLKQLITQLQASVPSDEPLAIAHGSWNLPGLTRTEFAEEAQSLADLIDEQRASEIDERVESRLQDYVRRLDFLRANTVPQLWSGNGGQAAVRASSANTEKT